MTEHDTDIDFDFFEDDEPPTQESSRTERLMPRRGPRDPQRPPRGPTNLTPLLRLVGLIAFAILIVVLLVFWIQSCQASSKEQTYKDYMAKVSEVAGSSQQIGKQLNQVLLAQGQKEAQLEQKITGLARQQQLDVQRAQQISPPGALQSEHTSLVQAMQYRLNGLNGLASALAATASSKDTTRAGTLLSAQMQRLLASDVIYQDSFKAPSNQELDRQGVTGTNANGGPLVPDSTFLQSADLVSPTAMTTVLGRIRGAGATPTTGGLRGTNIESTTVQPQGTQLSASTQTKIIPRTNMTFEVAVKNSGNSQEANIPVTLTIVQSQGGNIVKHATIAFISPGEVRKVTFGGDFSNISFAAPATVKVEVQPVQGETNTSNNSADYPVIFSTA